MDRPSGSSDPISFELNELDQERRWKGQGAGPQRPYLGIPRMPHLADLVGSRSTAIVALRLQGYTLAQIGETFEISGARVRQLVERAKVKWGSARTAQASMQRARGR